MQQFVFERVVIFSVYAVKRLGRAAANSKREPPQVSFARFLVHPPKRIATPVTDILESLMTGPVTQRPSAAGLAVDIYPQALPDGEGLTIPLGPWGEIGFRNEAGLLVLTVPLPAESWMLRRLSGAIERGPDHLLSQDGTSRVARVWIQLQSGMRLALPLGMIGEIRIESV